MALSFVFNPPVLQYPQPWNGHLPTSKAFMKNEWAEDMHYVFVCIYTYTLIYAYISYACKQAYNDGVGEY